jgi:Family of unknown function (DUF6010)
MSTPATWVDAAGAVVIAVVFILGMSRVPEPARQQFNALFVAGAGSVYFSGGFGPWEFVLPTVVTACAWFGLRWYPAIGLAWLAHTVFDVLHHLWGAPIIAMAPTSSFGCAVCDPLLAIWFFAGAPTLGRWK